jgi:hypothetical protein
LVKKILLQNGILFRGEVTINNDTLAFAAGQYDRKAERKYIGIFTYKKVDIP